MCLTKLWIDGNGFAEVLDGGIEIALAGEHDSGANLALRQIEPSVSMQRSIVHAVARLALAFVWLYQGIVPKLLWRASGELDLLREVALSPVCRARFASA